MKPPRAFLALLGLVSLALFLASCGPAATSAPAALEEAATQASAPGASATPGTPGAPGTPGTPAAPTGEAAAPATPVPAHVTVIEQRQVELEWPARVWLGESDVVRLSFTPSESGYVVTAEFPEHEISTQTIEVRRPEGYDLYVAARLEGVGFEIAPNDDGEQYLAPEDSAAWRWSLTPRRSGQQRLSIALFVRWKPVGGASGPAREVVIFSRGLDVRVASLLGLPQPQAMTAGLLGLLVGSGLTLGALAFSPRAAQPRLAETKPNPRLKIEPPAGMAISKDERALLQALFARYARFVIAGEFVSGYSGARTFLAVPVHLDGSVDAHTIVKIGAQEDIRQEFRNYETFVRDTLPPITARVQHPPVGVRGSRLGAIRYTFIGQPGSRPTSLRQALAERPDPALLYRLFETFGPNWWMQRQPDTFHAWSEYDRMLPVHLVVEPALAGGKARAIDGRLSPARLDAAQGDLVTLRHFKARELRPDGKSYTLQGEPSLRVRWLSAQSPRPGDVGRVVHTRSTYLAGLASGADLGGLPDPIARLPKLLDATIHGSRSIIHGDLNLENILVGPGELVWLIDFAQTRRGHPLFDFAHLEADLIAHLLPGWVSTPEEYLSLLQSLFPRRAPGAGPANSAPRQAPHQALQQAPQSSQSPAAGILSALHEIASRCLFNPANPQEYELALALTCLGALKFANLEPAGRRLLYLTSAFLVQRIED